MNEEKKKDVVVLGSGINRGIGRTLAMLAATSVIMTSPRGGKTGSLQEDRKPKGDTQLKDRDATCRVTRQKSPEVPAYPVKTPVTPDDHERVASAEDKRKRRAKKLADTVKGDK